MLSKEEGQPGTPEKPLSDLGRVSYYAYWKSVILEYLHSHRTEKIKLTQISKETGMYCQDISLAFQLLGFIKLVQIDEGNKPIICVDWEKVDNHMAKVNKSITRIPIDHECLRWTPLVTQSVAQLIEPRSDEDASPKETANIVVPMPEKIIIETPAGVKLKRGKKRKISTTPPRSQKATKVDCKTILNTSIEMTNEEVEITSSGRKRTRPSKFNETTFEAKPKTVETPCNKRKQLDKSSPKKKAKVESSSEKSEDPAPPPVEDAVKTPQIPESKPVRGGRSAAKPSEKEKFEKVLILLLTRCKPNFYYYFLNSPTFFRLMNHKHLRIIQLRSQREVQLPKKEFWASGGLKEE